MADDTENPLVSVVVPTYNRPESLPRAVESVIEQTYSNIELLVVDDYSRTPAEEVLGDLNLDFQGLTRFECIRHETNRGGSAARNTGIKASEGEFVAFLDDDDEWIETKVEKQVTAFRQADDQVGLVYTGVRQVDADGRTNAVKTPEVGGEVLKRLLCRNFIGTFSAVMVRADVIEQVGMLDERFPSWQDWEWYLRLAQHRSFLPVLEPLVVRYNDHDQMSSDFETKRDVSYPLLLETRRPIAWELGLERKFEAGASFELALAAIENRRFGVARQYLFRSLRQEPVSLTTWLYLGLALGGRFTFYPAQRIKRLIIRTGGQRIY